MSPLGAGRRQHDLGGILERDEEVRGDRRSGVIRRTIGVCDLERMQPELVRDRVGERERTWGRPGHCAACAGEDGPGERHGHQRMHSEPLRAGRARRVRSRRRCAPRAVHDRWPPRPQRSRHRARPGSRRRTVWPSLVVPSNPRPNGPSRSTSAAASARPIRPFPTIAPRPDESPLPALLASRMAAEVTASSGAPGAASVEAQCG